MNEGRLTLLDNEQALVVRILPGVEKGGGQERGFVQVKARDGDKMSDPPPA